MIRRVVLAIAAVAIAACARPSPPTPVASDSPPTPVASEGGVVRAGGARRVVSLAPSTTEALFAIGAGDRVVARSRFCDFPPEARALPIVGDVEPDLEAVIGLRPDLVVGVGGLTSDRVAARLGDRGIPAWFPVSGSLAAIDALLLGLGERTGRVEEARRVASAIDARERAIEASVAGEPRPRVILVVSLAPVVAAGPKSFADELIAAAGARNVVSEGTAWPILGFERLIDLDPDIVLDAAETDADFAGTRIDADAPGWRGLRAVRGGRVVPVRDERVLRAGPRIAEGLAVLARALHPRAVIP
jgi:iron complex transport system substrate-binding protein